MRLLPRLRFAAAALVATALPFAVPSTAAPSPTIWTAALPANEGFDHLSAFANGVVYVQYGDGYAKSTDFGAHWTMVHGPDGLTGASGVLRFTTPTRGYAIVNRPTPALVDPVTHQACPVGLPLFALDMTLDGGEHWLPACAPVTKLGALAHSYFVSGLYVPRDSGRLLVVGDSGFACKTTRDEHIVLFSSGDAGLHWRQTTLPGGYTSQLLGDNVYDARHAVVLAQHNTGSCNSSNTEGMYAFATTDGVHYHRVFRCPGVDYCTSAAWVNGRRLLVGADNGRLFVSTDAGRHFFRGALLRDAHYDAAIQTGAMDPRILWVQGMSFVNAHVGYASTRGSGTWRTADGGYHWVQENSPECVYYPFGVGDIAGADPRHGITGGPRSIDIRQPGTTELGCLTPQHGGPQLRTNHVVAQMYAPGGSGMGRSLDAHGQTATIARERR